MPTIRVPLSWLKEYAGAQGSTDDIARQLHMSGTEVELLLADGSLVEVGSAGGAGTTVTGALTGGISGRVAGSVEAIRVGGVASPLDGAEGTQRRTARSSSAR